MMNFGIQRTASVGIAFCRPATALYCGCGGGANIKTLLKLCPKGKVQGIHLFSSQCRKVRKVNAGAIAAVRVLCSREL